MNSTNLVSRTEKKMKLIKPFIFSAAGVKGVGRETSMCFLAEHLHDMGYWDLKYASNIAELLNILSIEDHHELNKAIIILPRITKADYDVLSKMHNCILFHISRLDYEEGASKNGIKFYHPSEDEKWIAQSRFDIHVTNDSTMRVLKWLIKDAFTNQILTNTKWIQAHGN